MPGEQSHKLAVHLLARQPKRALPSALTMFNIGKVSGGLAVVFALVLLWGMSTTNYIGYISSTLACFALVTVTMLFGGILLGLRAGLLNLVEFFCGLTVIPTSMLSGVYQGSGRSYQTLALVYSGCGRFDEAQKFFQKHENNFNPFDTAASSPWNERHRVPELLCRMGRDEEAQLCAVRNVERARKDLVDFDCIQLRQTLQCDLIVAAMVARDCGKTDEALSFLEEASATHRDVDNAQTRLLKLHSDGLLHMYQERFDEAIEAFSQCCRSIVEMRKTQVVSHTRNSELLGYSQYNLGQCYFKSDQSNKVAQVLSVLESENKYEPPTSVDKLMLDFTRADYKFSQDKADEALAILQGVIYKISNTPATFDRYLIEATKRYQALLQSTEESQAAAEIAAALEHLHGAQKLLLDKKSEQTQIQNQNQQLWSQPKLPDVSATARIANRSVFLFLAVLGYTIMSALTHPTQHHVVSWALCCFTLALAISHISDQVANRRGRTLAAEALQRGDYVDVVVSPLSTLLGSSMSTCRVDEGPEDIVGRKLSLAISSNMIYASQAAQAAPKGKIKARLYQQPGGKRILAIETMGRILTVKKPRFLDRDPSSLKLCL